MFKEFIINLKTKLLIKNIIRLIAKKNNFLILGHENPDEDCIASMSAIAIIIKKFNKNVMIYLSSEVHEHFHFLLNICHYNGIKILSKDSEIENSIDTVFICDTAKSSMIDSNEKINKYLNNKKVVKVEIDHHIGADSEVIGHFGYSLKIEASSASELVGMIAMEINENKKIINKYSISDPLSRNISLAVLTGIVGDSKMGKYLKSEREIRNYSLFSKLYNNMLLKETTNVSNFSNMDQVFSEIQRLSSNEMECYDYIIQKKKFSTSVGYSLLTEEDMNYLIPKYGIDIIVEMSRTATDYLAEESSKIGLVVYFDDPEQSDLVQFRMRRSNNYKEKDLRDFLKLFSIENGGGHEGAIGFRFPKNKIDNIDEFIEKIVSGVEEIIVS